MVGSLLPGGTVPTVWWGGGPELAGGEWVHTPVLETGHFWKLWGLREGIAGIHCRPGLFVRREARGPFRWGQRNGLGKVWGIPVEH
jgi:hypothetical protein